MNDEWIVDSAECEVQSTKCRVQSAECGVRSTLVMWSGWGAQALELLATNGTKDTKRVQSIR